MDPPDFDAVELNAFSDALNLSEIIASSITTINKLMPDPTIERMHRDLVETLKAVRLTYRSGVRTGEAHCRSGAKVAKEFIYILDESIAGRLRIEDTPDIVDGLIKRVTELLANAREMHACFGAVQTDLEKLEMKTNEFSQQVTQAIATGQRGIDGEKNRRKINAIMGVAFGLLGIVFHPALPLALGMGLKSGIHHENVVEGRNALKPWQSYSDNANCIFGVVKLAQSATEKQIVYWSHMLGQLESLDDYSTDYIGNLSSKWSAKKLVAQWRTVEKKYNEYAHTSAEAHRYLEAHVE